MELAANKANGPAVVVQENAESHQCCAICLNDICGGDGDRKLPECGHSFHFKCIEVWLGSHWTCPLCRAQVGQIIISVDRNEYEWNDLVSNILVLIRDFLQKMWNPPLNEELSSMLCANISCTH